MYADPTVVPGCLEVILSCFDITLKWCGKSCRSNQSLDVRPPT